MPALMPDPNLNPFESSLAHWVMEARSRQFLSLEDQIKLLKKWNKSWDKATK